MDENVCREKQKWIDEKIRHHDNWLGDHERKIDGLEKSDATNQNEIKHLCQQIGGQTKAIWGLVTTIAGVGFSFIIWYIQALGVR